MAVPFESLLDQVFTVESLMTPWDQLDKVEKDRITEAPIKAREGHFDLLPVVDNDRVIGIWYEEATDLEPVTERWLISRDTPIPYLLALFVESKRPGFLVLHRQDVVGLVTPADLNKLPARVYVYNLIGELELKLAAVIQEHFQDDQEQLRQVMGEGCWQKLVAENEELKQGNVDINLIQLLYLPDLINIIAKQKELRARLGFSSRNKAEDALGGFNELRKTTMHLVRPLLARLPDDLTKLYERVQRAEDVLQRFNP